MFVYRLANTGNFRHEQIHFIEFKTKNWFCFFAIVRYRNQMKRFLIEQRAEHHFQLIILYIWIRTSNWKNNNNIFIKWIDWHSFKITIWCMRQSQQLLLTAGILAHFIFRCHFFSLSQLTTWSHFICDFASPVSVFAYCDSKRIDRLLIIIKSVSSSFDTINGRLQTSDILFDGSLLVAAFICLSFWRWYDNMLSHSFSSYFSCSTRNDFISCGKWTFLFRIINQSVSTCVISLQQA